MKAKKVFSTKKVGDFFGTLITHTVAKEVKSDFEWKIILQPKIEMFKC